MEGARRENPGAAPDYSGGMVCFHVSLSADDDSGRFHVAFLSSFTAGGSG